MFNKILVANRGDIAVGIIRACNEMGIDTVAVHSISDAESLHTNLANECYCIGPASPAESYANINAILCTAVNSGADAIFAGYGFLSESIELSKRCRELGITFIGPSPEILEITTDKKAIKAFAREAGLPVSEKKLKGGYKEIDIQLICDGSENVLAIGDRDSSLQSNTSRMFGESPAYGISDKTRKKLYKLSRKLAVALGFVGIGSVNFYVDALGNICFKRFVPRLQVGCALSETQSRINLIKTAIKIAAGETITFEESELNSKGHTLGCRICAIHPITGMPSAGQISILHVPGGIGVRVDTAVYQNCSILPEYEPLLAKLIVHAGTREEAIRKMMNALSELVTEGVHNNSEIFAELISSDEFASGEYDLTSFEKFFRARNEY